MNKQFNVLISSLQLTSSHNKMYEEWSEVYYKQIWFVIKWMKSETKIGQNWYLIIIRAEISKKKSLILTFSEDHINLWKRWRKEPQNVMCWKRLKFDFSYLNIKRFWIINMWLPMFSKKKLNFWVKKKMTQFNKQ